MRVLLHWDVGSTLAARATLGARVLYFARNPVAAVGEWRALDEHEAIFALDHVVLAPHVAWLTDPTWGRSIEVAVENCRRLAAGEPLLHRVV